MLNKYIKYKILKVSTLFHDPGTILQEIKVIHNELSISEDKYNLIYYSLYKQDIINNKTKFYSDLYNKFVKSDFILIELTTIKTILCDNIYVDIIQSRRNNSENVKLYYKDDEIIFEKNIIKLIEFVKSKKKKIFIIGHIYSNKWKVKKLERRIILNQILEKVCNKFNVKFFNPSILLDKYSEKELLIDSSHYTKKGTKVYGNTLMKLLNNK